MKNKRGVCRFLALAMAVCLLLAQSSCAISKPHTEESNTQRLEVQDLPAVYDEAFVASVTERICDLVVRTVRIFEGAVLGETQTQSLRRYVEQTALPALQALPLYQQELEALLQSAQELCASVEEGTLVGASRMALFLRFYQSGLAEVDSAKLGALLYHVALSGLELLIDVNLSRYEKYGYKWYLEDAEHYRAQSETLQSELGPTAFSNVMAMLTFVASLLDGSLTDGGDVGLAVSDAELVMLLQKQSDHFVAMDLTEHQWSVAAELVCAWFVTDGDGATGAVLQALCTSGDAVRAAKALPAFFRYYQALTHAMDELYLDAILSNNQSARFSAWVSVLVECEDDLLELDRALALHVSEREDTVLALQRLGLTEAYEAFLSETPAGSAAELVTCLRAGVNSYRPEQMAELRAAWISYLRAYLPSLTFAVLYDQAEKGGE